MRRTVAITTLMITACVAARADTVQVGRLSYRGVQVRNAREGKVFFLIGRSRLLSKPLHAVTFLSIDGQGELNAAEELLMAGKAVEAVAAYDRALQSGVGWRAKLIRCRRLVGLGRTGMIYRATQEWLAVADESGAAPETLKLRPGAFAPKGSRQNADAIALLTAKRKRLRNSRTYLAAVDELLLDLYKHEGRSQAATKLAEEIAGRLDHGAAAPTRPANWPVSRLKALEVLIEQGKAEQALLDIQLDLNSGRYDREQLPAAMLLAGRAQRQLADTTAGLERRRRLIGAGLDFMRVATFLPASAQASQALLAAGEVNAALGNAWAAGNAYQMVIRRYKGSEAAKKAHAALEKLKKKEKP